MYEVTYGFYVESISQLADSLSKTLGIHLYLNLSPMTGSWYSSEDLDTIDRALRQHDYKKLEEIEKNAKEQTRCRLVLNNPEPSYTASEFPGGFSCLLKIRANSDMLCEIEGKLSDSELKHVELKRKQLEK